MIKDIKSKIINSNIVKNFSDEIVHKNVFLKSVHGSLISFIIDHCYSKINKKIIFLSNDPDKVLKIKDDLDLISGSEFVSLYSPDKTTGDEELTKSLTNLVDNKEFIVFINSDDLQQNIIPKNKFKESIIELRKNTEYNFEELILNFNKFNYCRNDFVEEVGDFSIRGGIIDLYPEHLDTPIRIEFFGDTIESIREFDITTQRSIREIDRIRIGMNLQANDETTDAIQKNETIVNYIPDEAIIFIDEPDIIDTRIENLSLSESFKNNRCIYFSTFKKDTSNTNILSNSSVIDFDSKPQPDFHSNLKQLYNNLIEQIKKGFDVFILCSDQHQSKRIKNLIEDFEDDNIFNLDRSIRKSNGETVIKKEVSIKDKFNVLPESLHTGFIFPDNRIVVYTEHQIFGRYFKQLRKKKKKFRGLTFDELKELRLGDYIVHRDFGIGIYSGLKRINVGNNEQEVVKLSYQGGDTVFLNLNYVNVIKKYSGTEGHKPKLTRLGGGEWDRIKARTKKKVKDIAKDLIILYAKRRSESGYNFSPDTHWQRELEANFLYEDTPDQMFSTEDVKRDMESENPMDRLICGDVGFGKTEVAIRAAFKAILDNKQVALLVPTTILAVQHYNTFRDRFNAFAVEVESISRLKPRKIQKEILQRLEDGKINIIIGTHRILSKDIRFKDLGLLIIDEEQRFGVKAKEKLRSLKPNLDTLTLTATPIPRTLNFSLLGARDLSIINTPPKNRKSIITEIINLDWNLISNVIRKELDRNGQVYFVNDKISNLDILADKLKKHVPEAKIGIAHGQMDGKELEDVVVNFIEKKLNVLLCTKIIESGLDIPNVNTIIINNANMYGLAELYQLRGRVGRSDIQAYAYFVSPPTGKLTRTAIRRLQAIEEYTELGSGFNLAMRDMEIRGVGNLLGKDQSGFVQQIGFEMFISIIDEAVTELKENEFKELFKNEDALKRIGDKIQKKAEEKSTIFENDLNALIPKDYVNNNTERLNIYKRLYELDVLDKLDSLKEELKDRFGEYLEDVENLFKVVELKIKATQIGLEKINLHNRELTFYFPQDKNHKIFKSDFFTKIIERISSEKTNKYELIDDKNKLIIMFRLEGDDDLYRLQEVQEILSI